MQLSNSPRFQQYLPRINLVIKAWRDTPYGRSMLHTFPEKVNDYSGFCDLPILTELTFDPESLTLDLDHCRRFFTSGTSGKQKHVYWPRSVYAEPLPKEVDLIIRNTHAGFIFSKVPRVEEDLFILAHLNTFKQDYPQANFYHFEDVNSVAKALIECETLYFFDYPSSFARFLSLIKQAFACGLLNSKSLRVHHIFAKLTGEPMTPVLLRKWMQDCIYTLNIIPTFYPRYGATEVLGIGSCHFDVDMHTLEYDMLHHNCYVEVLDPNTYKPIQLGRGIVVVTSFRTKGTILLRYALGDLADIKYVDTSMKLSHITRPNTLFVMGNTLSMNCIAEEITTRFGEGIHLRIERFVDDEGIQTVKIAISLLKEQKYLTDEIKQFVQELLIAKLRLPSSSKAVVLDVQITTFSTLESMRLKRWTLVT